MFLDFLLKNPEKTHGFVKKVIVFDICGLAILMISSSKEIVACLLTWIF